MSVIDFHAHVLPEIDDGSASVEQSIILLRELHNQGGGYVVAAPHFYANHHTPERFLQKRRDAEQKLRTAISSLSDLPKLCIGAEVHFFEGISDCEFLRDMAIEGTDCVLVEMPMKQWSERNLQELMGIRQKLKLTPIIAHVDRYISPFNSHGIPDQLATLPVYIQANANFFIKKTTRRYALKLLSQDKIHLLGSDCHDTDKRAPNIERAVHVITRALGEKAVYRINALEHKLMACLSSDSIV